MKTVLSTAAVTRLAADLLVVPVTGGNLKSPDLVELDRALDGKLTREAEQQGFTDERDSSFLFQTHGVLQNRHVLLIHVASSAGPATWYKIADAAVRSGREVHADSVAVVFGEACSAQNVAAVTTGTILASYRFTRYRTRPAPPGLRRLVLGVPDASANLEEAVARSEVIAAATCYARDLVNTPAGALTPAALAREALGLSRRGLTVRVHDASRIRRLGMGALLGVAQGSAQPPRFIEILSRPAGRSRNRVVALLGKGVTFDSGGLSLKNPDAMRTQKRDMAGGAVVLAVMSALPRLKLPIEVRGYVPAAENMPSGNAIKPGDVLRAFNGTTIEVLNTDAEGRLLLADALSYAASKRPDVLIDFATLTGAVNTALGSRYAAVLGTSDELIRALIEAGQSVHENLWQLPLAAEYRRDLDSPVADLKNIGEGQAGTIIGALFLREFVAEVPWAHVDFSSTAFSSGYPCHPVGASGFGVRTALEYLARLA